MPELEKDGCNPACVVGEENKTAEVNWRCTGALPLNDNDETGILPFDSGAQGQILLGPTCPVMREPPDPQCADKPYKTTVQVIAKNSSLSSPFATVEANKEGRYKVMLPPGEYNIQAVGKNPFPSCGWKDINIAPGTIIEVDLLCDTGIR